MRAPARSRGDLLMQAHPEPGGGRADSGRSAGVGSIGGQHDQRQVVVARPTGRDFVRGARPQVVEFGQLGCPCRCPHRLREPLTAVAAAGRSGFGRGVQDTRAASPEGSSPRSAAARQRSATARRPERLPARGPNAAANRLSWYSTDGSTSTMPTTSFGRRSANTPDVETTCRMAGDDERTTDPRRPQRLPWSDRWRSPRHPGSRARIAEAIARAISRRMRGAPAKPPAPGPVPRPATSLHSPLPAVPSARPAPAQRRLITRLSGRCASNPGWADASSEIARRRLQASARMRSARREYRKPDAESGPEEQQDGQRSSARRGLLRLSSLYPRHHQGLGLVDVSAPAQDPHPLAGFQVAACSGRRSVRSAGV